MMLTSIVLAVLMQATPTRQAGQELTGVVVDAQGRPAAGAEIFLSSLDRVDGENPTLGLPASDQVPGEMGTGRNARPTRRTPMGVPPVALFP
jgi:hypothetical protein